MKIKEFDIILDIKKPTEQEKFEVVQGDSGSNLVRISLMGGLESYDLTGTNVEIVFRKADGTTVQQTDKTGISIINKVDGKFQVILKTNTIACPGPVTAEVRVLEEEILLTSTRFNFFVRKSLINDETIESTNEFPILTQLVNDTKDIIESIPIIENKLGEITNTESSLNQSITEGNALKADLDTTIGEGNALKTGLDNSIADGNILKGDLGEIIAGTDYEHVLTELNNKLDKNGDSKDNIVTFAETDGELTTGSTHATLFGIIKKKFADIFTALTGKIDKTSIAQTTEVNDPDRVASTVITNGLQQSLNTLNNSLIIQSSTVTTQPLVITAIVNTIKKIAGGVMLDYTVDVSGLVTNDWNYIGLIPIGYRPSAQIFDAATSSSYDIVKFRIDTDGKIYVTSNVTITRVQISKYYLI